MYVNNIKNKAKRKDRVMITLIVYPNAQVMKQIQEVGKPKGWGIREISGQH